jgi:hypothetical protein
MRRTASRRIRPRVVVLATACVLALALASGAGTAVAAPAPSGGGSLANTWVPTVQPMSVARSGHTATRLVNGGVLIAGGTTTSAELYEPMSRTFVQTGSMSVARPGATATLLPDGRVLVAGGCCKDPTHNLGSAELYDPTTGTWTLTGSMHFPRSGHTATLLRNGRVLVAGGACNGLFFGCDMSSLYAAQSTAELYDPATGTWSATGGMHDGREFQTATLLTDGRVLMAGGFSNCDDSFCTDLSSAELYDPATGKWSVTGSMHASREQHAAALLLSGKVLVAGGLNQGGFGSNRATYATAELYDASAGTWTLTASMAVARLGHTATLLSSGGVLVTGGQTSSAEIYEPSAGVWATPGAMSTSRSAHTATLLTGGHVLVTGGVGPDGQPQPTAEVFLAGRGPLVNIAPSSLTYATQLVGTTGSPQTYTVTNLGSAPLTVSGIVVSGAHPSDFRASTDCTAGQVAPGAICTVSTVFAPLATGARSAHVAIADNAPQTPQGATVAGFGSGPNAWAPTASMATARDSHTATLLQSGKVLIAGGETSAGANPHSSAELYDPATRAFSSTGSMTTGRGGAAAILLPNGNVLVAGGKGANFANLSSAEIYHPVAGTWTATGSMNDFGYAMTLTLLPNGKVLATGLGFGTGAELYDPALGTWADTPAMVASHFFATAVLLTNGEVLVAGGGTAAAELYNPIANIWTATDSMNVARQGQTAALLPDGRVLVSGGDPPGGGMSLASAELYNPAKGTWAVAPSMNTGRYGQTATLLNGGVVMVAGGCTASCNGGQQVDTTEFYSATTGFWSFGPSLTAPRDHHTATLLADGDVLIAGGDTISCCDATATAELYTPTVMAATPNAGAPGAAFKVSGHGFFAGELVKVTWDLGTVLGAATTDGMGAFVVHCKVPATATTGDHTLTATGQTSFAGVQIPFKVF